MLCDSCLIVLKLVEQMQRTQLIIFFLLRGEPYTVRLLLESFKYLYDKIQIKFDLHFFVNDTNDRTCY